MPLFILQLFGFKDFYQLKTAMKIETEMHGEYNLKTMVNMQKTLHAFYESTKSIRLFLLPDYTILFFNKKAVEYFPALFGKRVHAGVDINRLLKKSIMKNEFIFHFKKALEAGSSTSEYVIGADPEKTWYKIDYHAVVFGTKTIGVSVSMRDITHHKIKESLLTHQKNVLADIIHSHSHLFRSPVANILGLLENLDRLELSESNKELIECIEISARELDQRIKTIVFSAYDAKEKANDETS